MVVVVQSIVDNSVEIVFIVVDVIFVCVIVCKYVVVYPTRPEKIFVENVSVARVGREATDLRVAAGCTGAEGSIAVVVRTADVVEPWQVARVIPALLNSAKFEI